jgi:hypothetical protein
VDNRSSMPDQIALKKFSKQQYRAYAGKS